MRTTGILTATIMSCAACILVACGTKKDAQEFVAAADAHYRNGEKKAAVIQLRNALQTDPDRSDARRLLGMIHLENGDGPSAEKELRRAMELGATGVTASLAKALLLQEQYDKVIDLTSRDAGNSDPAFLTMRGLAEISTGKVAEGKKTLEEALQLAPDSADARIGLSRVYLMQNDRVAAAEHAEKAVSVNPRSIEAWMYHGELQRLEKKYDEAIASFGKAVELRPDHLPAYLARASVHMDSGRFDAARADLTSAKKQAANAPVLSYADAMLYYRQGQHDKARESILEVLKIAPDHQPSALLAGAIFYELGATQQAEQHLKKYLDSQPGHSMASRLLVATLLKNGDAERAVKVLQPLLQKNPDDPQILTMAGETYMQAKDLAKASLYLEKASKIAPDVAAIRTALGKSHLIQGAGDRGIAELELAAELDPKSAQPGLMLAMAHVRNGQFDKALAEVARLQKAEPANPVFHGLEGAIYLQKKELAAARKSFNRAQELQPSFFAPVASLVQMDLAENKQGEARKRLEAFLTLDRKSVPAMAALASLELTAGRVDEATRWLERADAENPSDYRPKLMLVTHFLNQGKKEQALELARKVHASHDKEPDVLDVAGQALLVNAKHSEAVQVYSRLVALSPSSAVAHYRLASAQIAAGDKQAANKSLRSAVGIQADFPEAEIALANLHMDANETNQALRIAREMQKRNGRSAMGYEIEGDIHRKKDAQLAAKAYEQSLAQQESAPVLIKLYDTLRQAGKEKEAEIRLTKWFEQKKDDATVRLYIANAKLKAGQFTEAAGHYQAVLKKSPENVVALNNLAYALHQSKDKSALGYAEKAYALAGQNPMIMDTLGWILTDQGNTAKGLPLLQKAASLAPNSPEIRYHLAAAMVKSGDKAGARQELQTLLAKDKTFNNADAAVALLQQIQ